MKNIDLDNIAIRKGSHGSFREGGCVMELVSYMADEPWSDSPDCACPVLSEFLRRWNDDMNDEDRQILKPLIPKMVGSKSTIEIESKRRELISDWFFRVNVPAWLELADLKEYANAGRQKGMAADWQAARSAARAAAGAAGYTAGYNARAAAWAASLAASLSAASHAAWAAAWAASLADASAYLLPTKRMLQQSCLDLINELLDLKA
jgi:hypothetical protein